MTTTTAQTREELIVEYVARDALETVNNRVRILLEIADKDVIAKLPDENGDGLMTDARHSELFSELWPKERDAETAEYVRTSAESCYIAGRILRTIVYHADQLRGEIDDLFEMSAGFARETIALEKASDDA